MNFPLRTASFAAALLIATSVHAQDAGPYVGAGIGLVDAPSTTVTDTASRSVKFDNGNVGALSLGYAFGNQWRAEAELARRSTGLDTIGGANASGALRTTSLMGNVVYDFDVNAPITPYLGVGAGLARVKLNNASPFGASSINDTDSAFALQGLAGVSYAVNESVNLFADYRYFTTQGLDMNTRAGSAASFDTDNHAVMVGLRFSFGAPKPQPKPVPVAQPTPEPAPIAPVAPAPVADLARNYIVFFDWDKADITPEAAAIIRSAAANAGTMGVVRMALTGHADRSGPDAYNMRLSQRRADAVKAMFVSLGFGAGELAVMAKGETDPLVPTDDGVREPQNRRVEIVLP